MGRTNSTSREFLKADESGFNDYLRALRRQHQPTFEQLFDGARQFADAAGYANTLTETRSSWCRSATPAAMDSGAGGARGRPRGAAGVGARSGKYQLQESSMIAHERLISTGSGMWRWVVHCRVCQPALPTSSHVQKRRRPIQLGYKLAEGVASPTGF